MLINSGGSKITKSPNPTSRLVGTVEVELRVTARENKENRDLWQGA
jgi:hypothetical protein